jgi:hypothetical protein
MQNEWFNEMNISMIFYYYLICLLLIIFLAYLVFTIREIKFSLNAIDIALFLFYFYSVIRLIFTTQIPLYNARIICFTFHIVLYLLFKTVFFRHYSGQPNYSKYIILFAFLSAGLLQGIIGLFQTYEIFGYYRNRFIATGSFKNPAPYAGFIESVIPFSFGLSQMVIKKNLIDKLLKKYSLVTFLVCMLVLPTTRTRGAWVATFIGILFILFIKHNIIEKVKYYFFSFNIAHRNLSISL